MKDQDNKTANDENSTSAVKPKRRTLLKYSMMALIGAVFGAGTMGAASHGLAGWGNHSMGGGWCNKGRHFGKHDPARIKEHIDFKVEWVLKDINATDLQKSQIKEIVVNSIDKMQANRTQHQAMKKNLVALLSQPVLDPSKLDTLRKEVLGKFATTSVSVMDTVVEISKVLTPEQRMLLVERYQKRFN
ncbi:MAG: Spy/CpxP family protein refolding chaperone [Magnetococcales bacterium]|nr:Spy/CpxP family protein refolding chaperone [Magnetococcales bacterium]